MASHRAKALSVLVLILASILWGSSFLVIQETITHDLWFMLVVRFTIGAVAILILSRGRCLKIERKNLSLWMTVGFLIFLTFAPQTYGLQGTSIANSVVMTSMFVVLTPAILKLFFRIHPTLFQWLGCLLGILAFAILGLSQGFSKLNSYDFITLLTAVAVAFHTILFGKALQEKNRFYSVIFYQFFFASLILFAIHLLFGESSFPALNETEWMKLLYLGIASTAIPYIFQAIGQLHLPAIQVNLVISSEPLWALAVANIFRGDPISGAALFACSILLAANFVAEIKGSTIRLKPRRHK